MVVELVVNGRSVDRRTVLVHRGTGDREEHVAERLGCARRAGYRACPSRGDGSALTSVEGGATCATGRRVLAGVIDDLSYDACLRTCPLPASHGYRCEAAKNGEADWAVTCRRGGRVVRGQAAESRGPGSSARPTRSAAGRSS